MLPTPPVLLVIYRRPELTRRIFARIRAAAPARLYVAADGPRTPREEPLVAEARGVTEDVDWPCEVERDYAVDNLGCRRRVASALDWVFEREESAVVLEDDTLPDPSFFPYCAELLERYKSDERVGLVSGQCPYLGRHSVGTSYAFSRYALIWGWATWRRSWRDFDLHMAGWPDVEERWLEEQVPDPAQRAGWREGFEAVHQGHLDTWDFAWNFAKWQRGSLCAVPAVNLVSNIGFDARATHTDHASPMAGLPAHAVTFPLRHPADVVRDDVGDAVIGRNLFTPRPPPAPAPRERLRAEGEELLATSGRLARRLLATARPAPSNATLRPPPRSGRLRIVMLSDQEAGGGSATAACRLAAGFARSGHDVVRIVHYPRDTGGAWKTIPLLKPPATGLGRVARLQPSRRLRRRWLEAATQADLRAKLTELSPDVITVHNLHGAAVDGWTPALVGVCAEQAPTAWRLSDMWSFTGRCDYAADCGKFVAGCDASCPTPGEYPSLPPERIAPAWAERARLFAAHPDLVAVAPSRWLARRARAGLWRSNRVEVIPPGFALDLYRPVDRDVARQALGVEARGPVLLFAADLVSLPRKGFDLLAPALARLGGRELTLLTLGKSQPDLSVPGLRVVPLGHVTNPRAQALAYSAADLLLHPAKEDNLPLVVLEAMACGTPTVAFRTGGLPELVRPGETGWLAAGRRPRDLAEALEAALEDLAQGVDLRASCRRVAEAEYGAERELRRYLGLFGELRAQQAAPLRSESWAPLREKTHRAVFRREIGREPTRSEVRQHRDRPVAEAALEVRKTDEFQQVAARRRQADGWRLHGEGQVLPIGGVVRSTLDVDPAAWEGTLHLHQGGKAGELLFLTGVIPGLRAQLPRARIVLHTLAPYAAVLDGAGASFDAVELSPQAPGANRATAVALASYRDMWPGFAVDGGDLRVSPFRTHRWFRTDPAVSQGPFFLAFADAVGCPRDAYALPTWTSEASPLAPGPLALALPTANVHSSSRGGLPFTTEQWASLAADAEAAGLTPVATGVPEDGRPDLPGWRWLNLDLAGLLTLLDQAELVVGAGSGMTYAACLLSPGRVVMLDDALRSEDGDGRYDLSRMGEHLDLERCTQLRLPTSGARDEEAFALCQAQLTPHP